MNVGNNPVAITTSNFNSFVYVVDQEVSPNATVLGFSENTSTGALTVVPGTVITTVAGKTVATGFAAGTIPSAIAEDPTARFVYVTDQATNQLYGNVVQANGSLIPMVNGPFTTGVFPVAITIDPRGEVPVRCELQFEYGKRLCDRSGDGHSVSDGWIDGNTGQDRTNLPDHRACAGHLSLHIEFSGWDGLGTPTGSTQWRPERDSELAIPGKRLAELRGGCAEWAACDADCSTVD